MRVSNNLYKKFETPKPLRFKGFNGAAGRIRTADLILTKDALYRLSYSSMSGAIAPNSGDAEGT